MICKVVDTTKVVVVVVNHAIINYNDIKFNDLS